jgi:hypothetical protein
MCSSRQIWWGILLLDHLLVSKARVCIGQVLLDGYAIKKSNSNNIGLLLLNFLLMEFVCPNFR